MKDYYFTSEREYESEECKSVAEAVKNNPTAHVIIQGSQKRIHLDFQSPPPGAKERNKSTALIALKIINKYVKKWGLSDAIPYLQKSHDCTATIAFGGNEQLDWDDYGRQLKPNEHRKHFEELIMSILSD